MMDNIRWVMQNNLIAEKDLSDIKETCNNIGVELQELYVIPFTNELPEIIIDDKTNIYYGSTTLMSNIYRELSPVGLFYNHNDFTMENYLSKWGKHMLNSDSNILTIEDFFKMSYDSDVNIFIRPNGDGKEFDGQVMKFNDAVKFLNRYMSNDDRLKLDSKILVGPAYDIYKEWRNYVVGGKVVTSSLHKIKYHKIKPDIDINGEIISNFFILEV